MVIVTVPLFYQLVISVSHYCTTASDANKAKHAPPLFQSF